jgi:hypothetical protein
MNFFSGLLKQKAKSQLSLLRSAFIAFVVAAGLLGVYFYLEYLYYQEDMRVVNAQAKLQNPDLLLMVAKAESMQRQNDALDSYLSALTELDRRINMQHKFTATENYEIMKAFPPGTRLYSLNFTTTTLAISGVAINLDLVPATVQNLTDSGLFTFVYPPSTSWQEMPESLWEEAGLWSIADGVNTSEEVRGVYTFSISCTFRPNIGEGN